MLTSTRTSSSRRRLGAVLTAGAVLAGGLTLVPGVAVAAPSCGLLGDAVHQVVKPGNDASLLTASSREIAGSAARTGFTDDQGAVFRASTQPAAGLVPVRRMYRDAPQDFIATRSTTELVSAALRYGYEDQGIRFYVSPVQTSCYEPVARYRKDGRHRLAQSQALRGALEADGWTYENVAFYAAPVDTDAAPSPDEPSDPEPTEPVDPPATGGAAEFSFAVVPDTQNEVLRASDTRLVNRNQWLVRQQPAFVVQTGDLVNWDTDDHRQMAMAKNAMDVLEDAGIDYSVAVGNHDTAVTGVGGGPRDASRSYQLARDTSTLNAYFKASDFGGVAGAYEAGKVDNVYSTFTAGGLKWLVLSLEFCARPGAVAWAERVVAGHPDYNVIVSTHSYQNALGGIDASSQGYGDTSGAELWDELVGQYPNITMVFSGHVGLASRARVDTGVNGNKVYSFLTTMHDGVTNPVRMLDVDTEAGTISTRIYAPLTGTTWGTFTQTVSGVDFVR